MWLISWLGGGRGAGARWNSTCRPIFGGANIRHDRSCTSYYADFWRIRGQVTDARRANCRSVLRERDFPRRRRGNPASRSAKKWRSIAFRIFEAFNINLGPEIFYRSKDRYRSTGNGAKKLDPGRTVDAVRIAFVR